MERAQKSQAAFVAFTVVQIGLFLFYPKAYESVMQGVEGAPDFASLRLIGVKEIGFMALYTAGILTNDHHMALVSVFGRLSTIVVLPYLMLKHGTSPNVLGGIPQDVIGSLATLYFLYKDRDTAKPKVPKLPLSEKLKLIPRATVLVAGLWEAMWGIKLCNDPLGVPLVPRPTYGEPTAINLIVFGYMTSLVGCYQIALSLIPSIDPSLYLAAAFYHGAFWTGVNYLLPAYTGKNWTAPNEHLYFAGAIVGAVGLAKALYSSKPKTS